MKVGGEGLRHWALQSQSRTVASRKLLCLFTVYSSDCKTYAHSCGKHTGVLLSPSSFSSLAQPVSIIIACSSNMLKNVIIFTSNFRSFEILLKLSPFC